MTNNHVDECMILFVATTQLLFLAAVLHHFKHYCMTLNRNYRFLQSTGREATSSSSPGTHVLGLCFLEDSLILCKPHRLVSRRNIVPIL